MGEGESVCAYPSLRSAPQAPFTIDAAGREERHVLLGAVHVAPRGAASPDARRVVVGVMNGATGEVEHLRRSSARGLGCCVASNPLQADPPRRGRA